MKLEPAPGALVARIFYLIKNKKLKKCAAPPAARRYLTL
jgi:hypothetical protein